MSWNERTSGTPLRSLSADEQGCADGDPAMPFRSSKQDPLLPGFDLHTNPGNAGRYSPCSRCTSACQRSRLMPCC